MSGEAGASYQSELYTIGVSSGLSVSVAIPPGDDGSAVGGYFERESRPFHLWLDRARAPLDALFAQLVAAGEPLVPLAHPHQELHGVFLEDGSEAHFRKYYKGGPLAVHLDGDAHLTGGRSLTLSFLVSTRVERRRMEAIVARAAAILQSTLPDPFEAPEPEPEPDDLAPAAIPPPPRPSWWSRLFRR
jgi:hypothetical protein